MRKLAIEELAAWLVETLVPGVARLAPVAPVISEASAYVASLLAASAQPPQPAAAAGAGTTSGPLVHHH